MIWLTKNWKYLVIVLSALAAAIGALVLNRRGMQIVEVPSVPDVKTELRAVKAEARVQKLQAKMGADLARGAVERDYEAAKEKLTEDQKREAEALRKDPAKLAAWLVRAGK